MSIEVVAVNLTGLTWDQYMTVVDALDIAHRQTGSMSPTRYSEMFSDLHERARQQLWELYLKGTA